MTIATSPGLTVVDVVELLLGRGFRVTIIIDDVVVAERAEPTIPHGLRRVVVQTNGDGSWRCGYLLARPGQPGGPIYQNELLDRELACRDLAQLTRWLTIQDARRAYPL
jgi:hypothetical protein